MQQACPPLPQLAVAAHEVALEAPQHTTVRSCISGGFRHAQRTGLSAMYLSIARHARDLELYRVVQVLAQ